MKKYKVTSLLFAVKYKIVNGEYTSDLVTFKTFSRREFIKFISNYILEQLNSGTQVSNFIEYDKDKHCDKHSYVIVKLYQYGENYYLTERNYNYKFGNGNTVRRETTTKETIKQYGDNYTTQQYDLVYKKLYDSDKNNKRKIKGE